MREGQQLHRLLQRIGHPARLLATGCREVWLSSATAFDQGTKLFDEITGFQALASR